MASQHGADDTRESPSKPGEDRFFTPPEKCPYDPKNLKRPIFPYEATRLKNGTLAVLPDVGIPLGIDPTKAIPSFPNWPAYKKRSEILTYTIVLLSVGLVLWSFAYVFLVGKLSFLENYDTPRRDGSDSSPTIGLSIIVAISSIAGWFFFKERQLTRLFARTFGMRAKGRVADIPGIAFNWEWRASATRALKSPIFFRIKSYSAMVANLTMAETKFSWGRRHYTDEIPRFEGMAGQIDFRTGYKGRILILANRGSWNKYRARWLGLEQVNFADSAFENQFEVYAENTEAASIFLTPESRKRLLDLPRNTAFALDQESIELEIMPQHVRFLLPGTLQILKLNVLNLPDNPVATIKRDIMLIDTIVQALSGLGRT